METELFSGDELLNSGVEESLNQKIIDYEIQQVGDQHYSQTARVKLLTSDGERTIFFKGRKVNPAPGDYYGTSFLRSHFLRETAALTNLYISGKAEFCPEMLGRRVDEDRGKYNLWMEFLLGNSARDRYLNLAEEIYQLKKQIKRIDGLEDNWMFVSNPGLDLSKNRGEIEAELVVNQEKKLQFLREDFSQIARMNGSCHAGRKRFGSLRDNLHYAYKKTKENRGKRLVHYLAREYHFRNMGGMLFQQSKGEKGNKFESDKALLEIKQRKSVNLIEEVNKIMKLREAIVEKAHLRLGDCRLQHNIGGRFCDWEDFGFYSKSQDIAQYTGEEIATPPVDALPQLLTRYFIEENQVYLRFSGFSKEEIEQSTDQEADKIIANINPQIRADFVIGYFAEVLEDDIIVSGVRKKYNRDLLTERINSFPGFTFSKIHESKYKHIRELYDFLTSPLGATLFQRPTNPEGVISYFQNFGVLLSDKLGLVNLENLGNLDELRKGIGEWQALVVEDKK